MTPLTLTSTSVMPNALVFLFDGELVVPRKAGCPAMLDMEDGDVLDVVVKEEEMSPANPAHLV